MPAAHPFAVGLVHLDQSSSSAETVRACVGLGAMAVHRHLILIQTFVVNGLPVKDDLALSRLVTFIDRCEVQVLLVSDDVPFEYLRRFSGSGLRSIDVVPSERISRRSRSGLAS